MRTRFLVVALSTTCLVTAPVYADITPEEAWQSYQDMIARIGMSPTADVSREGDTLVVRNMVYTMEMAGTQTSSTAPELRFQERPGGTVALSIEAPISTIVTTPLDPVMGDGPLETHSSVAYEGEVLISGDATNQLYTVNDVSMIMETQPVVLEDQMIQPGLTATMTGISGTYTLEQQETALSSVVDMTASTLEYDIDPMTDADSTVELGFSANNLAVTGTALLPEAEEDGDVMTLLKDGDIDVQMQFADSTLSAEISEGAPETAMNVAATTGPTTLDVQIKAGAIGYDTTTQDLDLTFAGAQIPGGAAKITLREYSGGILFPLAAADTAQPFKITVGLEDLTLPDIAWMIADPTGQIPHDPATLRVALDGTLKSDVDLFDVAALSALEDSGEAMPIQMKTLNLPELYLALAGATIQGDGAGHFLDQEAASPEGLPPFAGTLSMKLTGVTELIDKLATAGILPQEEAMSVQMMLGLFARPGDVPGELISEIEMGEDGSIIANGQPLPF